MGSAPRVTNIHDDEFVTETNSRGETWTRLDLDSARLGVRVEIMQPGASSSIHHWHTQEEEHVIILEGNATLVLGHEGRREMHALRPGDHVCFRAGEPVAHHLEATGDEPVRLLVFGERLPGDTVVYPDAQVMMVKAMDRSLFTYRPFSLPAADGDADADADAG